MPKLLTLKLLNEKIQKVMDQLQVQESFQPDIRSQVNTFAVRLVALENKIGGYSSALKRWGKTELSEYTSVELMEEIERRLEDSE